MTELEKAKVLHALKAALALLSEKDHALDRFDWGKSWLRAQDIRELNETPGLLHEAIEILRKENNHGLPKVR